MARALTSVSQLADLPDEEVRAFFATEDPEHIVGLVDHASDKELRALVSIRNVRDAAVEHILDRLGEFAVPERLADVRGVVEFVIDVPDAEPECQALLFNGTGVDRAAAGAQPADVTIATSAFDFVRLVSGGVNAAVLLLGGRLSVTGDELLALAVGGVFRVPGRSGVAVDPSTVDPEQVAEALRHVKDAHLRTVMSGGFRAVVLDQVFTRLPEYLDARKAAGHRLSVGFTVTGRSDGGVDRWTVHVADGTCRVEPDGEGRDATITLDGADFLKLVTGHLNPVTGAVRGRLKVRGDLKACLTLHRVMRVPGS